MRSLRVLMIGVACTLGMATTATASPPAPAGPAPEAALPTADQLAHSVVQIMLEVGDDLVPWGSGTVISDDGLVLTNAHVATPSAFDPEIPPVELVVAVTVAADAPPTPTYRAEVIGADVDLDLAVIRATQSLDGAPYVSGAIPAIGVADSDQVHIGDNLQILGYPGIGGDTITFTSGRVSGFTGDATFGQRAWIKTDATIAGGNSGGLAANERGELVGIPTQASAGTDTEIADCRPVRDTDGDGDIDDVDDCVPIGGFLNGIRPVNFARDLIAAAQGAAGPAPVEPAAPIAPQDFDVSQVRFESLALGDVEPAPGQQADVVWVASASQLCGGWTFSAMADGVSWDAVWAHDGTVDERFSQLDQAWAGGERGDWWVCAAVQGGLVEEGIWDLTLNVDGELVAGAFIAVGASLQPVTLTFTNAGTEHVCYLQSSPTTSTFWGADWLGPEQTVAPGQSVQLNLPPTTYDIRGLDCDQTVLFEDSVTLTEATTYTYTGTGSGTG